MYNEEKNGYKRYKKELDAQRARVKKEEEIVRRDTDELKKSLKKGKLAQMVLESEIVMFCAMVEGVYGRQVPLTSETEDLEDAEMQKENFETDQVFIRLENPEKEAVVQRNNLPYVKHYTGCFLNVRFMGASNSGSKNAILSHF